MPTLHTSPAVSPRRQVVAAALLLGSAILQYVAAAERWLVAPASWTRSDRWVEDHLFDYSYPADPWENIGAAAQWFGVGYVMLALGVLALAGTGGGSGNQLSKVSAVVAAMSSGLIGVHAFLSGVLGQPTFLQGPLALSAVVGPVALLGTALVYARSSPLTALACILLLITTVPGYLFASMGVAPAVIGTQSYDTTPHTETVVATSTAAAAFVLMTAAMVSALRRRRRREGTARFVQQNMIGA
ncbi:MAG: hypothetical protein PIR02_12525 [Microbacterium enclense]